MLTIHSVRMVVIIINRTAQLFKIDNNSPEIQAPKGAIKKTFSSAKQIREAVRGFIDSIIKVPLQVIDRLCLKM